MISFNCPSCGKQYRVAPEHAGKKVRCKACQGVMSVPAAAVGPAVAMSAPAPSPVEPSVPATSGWSSFPTHVLRFIQKLMGANTESLRRQRTFVLFGVVLAALTLTPNAHIASLFTVGMFRFTMVWQNRGMPVLIKLAETSLPLLAVGVIAASVLLKDRKRGLVILSSVAFYVLLMVLGSLLLPKRESIALGADYQLATSLLGIFAIVTFLGLISASRALWYRPENRVAHPIALAGAVCGGILLLVPMGDSISSMLILAPFNMSNATMLARMVVFLESTALLVAVILALKNRPSEDTEEVSERARVVFWIATGTAVLFGVVLALASLSSVWEFGMAFIDYYVRTTIIQIVLVALLFASVTDVIVGPSEPAPSDE